MDIHRPTILVHDRSQVTDGEQLGICHVDESYRATLVDTLLAVERSVQAIMQKYPLYASH